MIVSISINCVLCLTILASTTLFLTESIKRRSAELEANKEYGNLNRGNVLKSDKIVAT